MRYPFCNVSRDNCAIPHKNKHERVLRHYRCKSQSSSKIAPRIGRITWFLFLIYFWPISGKPPTLIFLPMFLFGQKLGKSPKKARTPTSHFCKELRNIYHHHPENNKRKSSERISGAIDLYGRYGNAGKTSKTISTIAILWPVKAVFEKWAATVEVDIFISPAFESFLSHFWVTFGSLSSVLGFCKVTLSAGNSLINLVRRRLLN